MAKEQTTIELLQEALQVIRQREQNPGAAVSWEEFKAELRQVTR